VTFLCLGETLRGRQKHKNIPSGRTSRVSWRSSEAFPKGRYPKELILEYARRYPEGFIVVEVENDLAGYMIYDIGRAYFFHGREAFFRRRGLGRMMFAHAGSMRMASFGLKSDPRTPAPSVSMRAWA
jgi:hypothetical protein